VLDCAVGFPRITGNKAHQKILKKESCDIIIDSSLALTKFENEQSNIS